MTELRKYLESRVGLEYRARDWDCSKLAVCWLAIAAPEAAKAAAKVAVEAGYNDVAIGDDAGLAAVQAALGVKTPDDFAAKFHRDFPELVDLPLTPRPGDIAVRREGLALGVIDEDCQVVYLAKPRGYIKQALRPGDAVMRGVK